MIKFLMNIKNGESSMKNKIKSIYCKSQKFLIYFLTFILSIISYLTFIIAYSGKNIDEYKIVNMDESPSYITNISIDGKKNNLEHLQSYDKNTKFIKLDDKEFKISLSSISSLSINFKNYSNIKIFKNKIVCLKHLKVFLIT